MDMSTMKCFTGRKFYRRLNIKYSLRARCRLKGRQCVPVRSSPKQRSEHFPGSEGALSNAEGKLLWHFMRRCFTVIHIFHCSTCLAFTDEPTDFVVSSATLTSFFAWYFWTQNCGLGELWCFYICSLDGFTASRSEPTFHERSLLWTRQISWSV